MYHHLRPVAARLLGGVAVCGGGVALAKAQREDECDTTVDYIVVGAGSSGCAVAARLAQGAPNCSTLLLEAGQDDDVAQIQTAVDYFGKVEHVFGSDRDWIYGSEPQPEIGGRGLYWPRGKVVGGCSSFNTMVFLRGDPRDFDHWARLLGDASWAYDAVLPYFRRAETHPAGPSELHGAAGPITVAPLDHPWHHPDDASSFATKAFVRAAVAMGVPANRDFAETTSGVGCNDVNARGGRRCSTSAYLKMVGAYPRAGQTEAASPSGALRVELERETRRVLWDRGGAVPRAVGVEVARRGGAVRRYRARREVVVCCGAVNSPLLLLRSGVGPKKDLERRGIPVVRDAPGVGQHLIDHLHVPLSYRVAGGVKPHSHSNICEGSLFTRLRPAAGDARGDAPDLQVHLGTVFFHPDGFNPIGEGFTLTPSLIHPRSRGSVCLRDDSDHPLIRPNYLTDPEGYDLKLLVDGVKLCRDLGRRICADVGATEVHPGPAVETDADVEDYVRKYVSTMYHPVGTCRMGDVVDAALRVRGVAGLRVADASVMPDIVGCNTNATCVMIGERCADLVLTAEPP